MVAKKKFSTMDAADFAVPKIHSALADAILQENAREHAQIPFNRLRPNPRQPRKQFNPTHLQELADDIAKNGLIEEIVVRRCPNQAGWFEIVCGERRTRACRDILGWTSLPAQIRECNDGELLRIALAENEHHQQLTPYERALAYAALRAELSTPDNQMTVRELAVIVNKHKDHIQLHLNLLKAPADLLQWIQDDPTVPLRILDELRKVEDEISRAELMRDVQEKRYKQDDILAIVRTMRQTHPQETPAMQLPAVQAHSSEQQSQPSFATATPVPDMVYDVAQRKNMLTEVKELALPPATSLEPQPEDLQLPSATLRVAKRQRTLAKDDMQVKHIIHSYQTQLATMTEEEKRLLRSMAQQWLDDLHTLLHACEAPAGHL